MKRDHWRVPYVGHAQTLALDHALAAITKNGLVGGDLDGVQAGVIVADAHSGRIRLVVGAPVVLVDGELASRASSPGSTARVVGGTLSAGEVKGLLENDDTRGAVRQIGDPVRWNVSMLHITLCLGWDSIGM